MAKGRDLFRKCYGIIYILIIFNIFVAVESKSPSNRIEPTPTVYSVDRFDPVADAETLQKAMKGSGADTKAIADVLTTRNLAQRLKIAETYKVRYGEDLHDKFEFKLSGIIKNVIMALITPVPQYYAEELHRAFAGLRTDKVSILEIFCTLNNSEIESVAKAYEQTYHTTLEKNLKKDNSAQFQIQMASVVRANRDENADVDEVRTSFDVKELFHAGEDTYDAKVTQFNKILMSRSYRQLRATFAEYKRLTGHKIEEKIKKDIHGLAQVAFLTIVKCAKSKASFFAEKLHTAMDRFETDYSTLIHIIVSRSEIDLSDIKEAFLHKYGETLESRITDCTSADYQKILLSLLGN